MLKDIDNLWAIIMITEPTSCIQKLSPSLSHSMDIIDKQKAKITSKKLYYTLPTHYIKTSC